MCGLILTKGKSWVEGIALGMLLCVCINRAKRIPSRLKDKLSGYNILFQQE